MAIMNLGMLVYIVQRGVVGSPTSRIRTEPLSYTKTQPQIRDEYEDNITKFSIQLKDLSTVFEDIRTGHLRINSVVQEIVLDLKQFEGVLES
jgi:hypothetical protein